MQQQDIQILKTRKTATHVDDGLVPNPIFCDTDRAMNIYDLVDDTVPFLGTDNIVDYGTVKSVKVKDLISIYAMLYEKTLLHFHKNSPLLQYGQKIFNKSYTELPIIYKVGKSLIIADGDYRIAHAILNGQTKVIAKVINISKLIKSL